MDSGTSTGRGKPSREKLAAAVLRQPGRTGMFAPGSPLLHKLLRYLARPGSTYRQAAKDFGCSLSTIEKVAAREKKRLLEEDAPVPCTDSGAAQSDAEAPATQQEDTSRGVA